MENQLTVRTRLAPHHIGHLPSFLVVLVLVFALVFIPSRNSNPHLILRAALFY